MASLAGVDLCALHRRNSYWLGNAPSPSVQVFWGPADHITFSATLSEHCGDLDRPGPVLQEEMRTTGSRPTYGTILECGEDGTLSLQVQMPTGVLRLLFRRRSQCGPG